MRLALNEDHVYLVTHILIQHCMTTPPAANKNLLIEMLLLLTAVIWALNFSVVKMSLAEIDPLSFNGFRFALATATIWLALLRSGQSLKVEKGDWGTLIVLGLLGNLVYQMLFIFGIDRTYSANAAVMLGTIPVWVGLVSHFFASEKLTVLKSIGVGFAFAGVATIMAGSETGLSLASDNLVGDLIIIVAAAVFGIYTVRSRKLLDRYTPLQLSTLTMITGGLALVLAGLPSMIALDYSSVSAGSWGGVFYSGVFSIGFAFIVWNYGILRVGAVRTATYQNLVPVMGLVFGFIILGEKLSLLQYGGSALVIIGIVMARWKRK